MGKIAKKRRKMQESACFFAKNCKKVQEIAKKCAFLLKNARVMGCELRVAGCESPGVKNDY